MLLYRTPIFIFSDRGAPQSIQILVVLHVWRCRISWTTRPSARIHDLDYFLVGHMAVHSLSRLLHLQEWGYFEVSWSWAQNVWHFFVEVFHVNAAWGSFIPFLLNIARTVKGRIQQAIVSRDAHGQAGGCVKVPVWDVARVEALHFDEGGGTGGPNTGAVLLVSDGGEGVLALGTSENDNWVFLGIFCH